MGCGLPEIPALPRPLLDPVLQRHWARGTSSPVSGVVWWGRPTHPSPISHQGQCRPRGHSLDELPSKGFQLARRCCCCQQQVQALPRQHVTQDPQQALRGLGVIRIHGLQNKIEEREVMGNVCYSTAVKLQPWGQN